ncbi:MAG: hypothetical protein ACKOPS_21880, partial [Cyanobium sp.]
MAAESGSDKSPRVLGGFASILSLLGITLFFSGWIYRWAYFAYYSLNLNDQSFTAQSYLIVPIQIYFGTLSGMLKTILLLLLLPLLITTTLAVLRRLAALLGCAGQPSSPASPAPGAAGGARHAPVGIPPLSGLSAG